MARRQRGFTDGLYKFSRKIKAFDTSLLPTVGQMVFDSIVGGSMITGAPGQPVGDTGGLSASWTLSHPSETSIAVTSDSPYALQNETGVRKGGKPYVQHSAVGGRHSVGLTRVGMQFITDEAARRVVAERGT